MSGAGADALLYGVCMQVPAEFNGFVYIADGAGKVSGTKAAKEQVGVPAFLSAALCAASPAHATAAASPCLLQQWVCLHAQCGEVDEMAVMLLVCVLLLPNQALVLGPGDSVVASSDSGMRFLLAAGRPIGEPIVQHGPFVMNTQARTAPLSPCLSSRMCLL
jgi:hypothetical protein